MSDDASARLTLPYLAAGQRQKHVTLNEALTRLDALVQAAVVSRSLGAQPATPGDGALFLLPGGATGEAWAGHPAGTLMRFEAGSWTVVAAPEGSVVAVIDEGRLVVRHAGDWRDLGEQLGAVQGLTRLGIDTTADAGNPFAARLNTALWTTRDGDLRMTLNKAAAGDVLSLLFQSGFSGRAELGLIGDDDLTLKVSADGSAWSEAARIDRSSGRVSLARGALRQETSVLTADGAWSPPDWAQRVEAVCVAGGGGGGGGLAGAAGSPRHGGGGGGSGGVSIGAWPATALSAGLTVTIGTAGAGGAAGLDGGTGGDTVLLLGGQPLLRAGGGEGGLGGSAASGPGRLGRGVAERGERGRLVQPDRNRRKRRLDRGTRVAGRRRRGRGAGPVGRGARGRTGRRGRGPGPGRRRGSGRLRRRGCGRAFDRGRRGRRGDGVRGRSGPGGRRRRDLRRRRRGRRRWPDRRRRGRRRGRGPGAADGDRMRPEMDQPERRSRLTPLLDEETWETPDRLSLRDWRGEAGGDWSWGRDETGADTREGEDDQ